MRVGLHGSCPFPGDDAACLFGTGVVCDSFLAGETRESSRNYLRVGATLRVLGGIFMTSSRWLTRFIAQGIAPQAGLGKWRIFEQIFESCKIFLVDFYRFCQKNRQNTLSWHLLPTPGDFFSRLFLWWLLLFVLYISMDFRRTVSECWVCWTSMVLRSLKRLQRGMLQTASHSWSDSLPAKTGFPYQWLWAIPDQLLPTSKPARLCFIFFSTRKVCCQETFRCKPWGEEGLLEWGKSARWPLAWCFLQKMELGTLKQLRQRAFAAILQPPGWWHPNGQRMIFTKYAVWLGCYLHHVGIQRGNVAFHLDIYILDHISFGMKRVGYQRFLHWGAMNGTTRISSWDQVIQYTSNPGLCSGGWGIRSWRPCQCCNIAGEGCTLLNWWRRWEIWGGRHVAYPTVLFFFLKAFIKNHESKIWFRFSPTKRFFAPEV